MSKTKRPSPDAERIAATIVADLAPCCDRIQVAGSVRQRTEVVGDIEIVAIPRYAPASSAPARPISSAHPRTAHALRSRWG